MLRGATVAMALRVVGAGLAFLFNVALGRLVGAHGAGLYYLALTAASVAAIVGRLGLENAMLRFAAAAHAQGDRRALAGVQRLGLRVALGASALTTLAVLLAARWLSRTVFSEPALVLPLALMAIAVVPTSLLTLYGELLRALGKVRDYVLVQSVLGPGLGLVLLLVLAPALGATGAVLAHVAAAALVTGVAAALWRRATPGLREVAPAFDLGRLLRTSLPLLWIAAMAFIMGWTDTVMLGIWEDARTVGIYGAATRASMLTSFILVGVNAVAAPKFAALYAQGERGALDRLARNATKLMAVAAAPFLVLFLVAPGLVLRLFGPEFPAGAAALAILAVGQFVNVASGSVGYLLVMTGHEKAMRNDIIGTAALNVALNALLIPRYGMTGAAVATALSLAVLNLVAVALVHARLSILTLPVPWVRSRR